MWKFVGRLAVIAVLWPSFSYALCSKPDAPSCASDFGRFDDDTDFQSCKSEMENYKSEIEDFLDCLKRENEEAIEEYNDAVRSFNDRARGG